MRDVEAGEKRLVNGEYLPIVRPVAEPRLDVMIDSSGACSARNAFSNPQ